MSSIVYSATRTKASRGDRSVCLGGTERQKVCIAQLLQVEVLSSMQLQAAALGVGTAGGLGCPDHAFQAPWLSSRSSDLLPALQVRVSVARAHESWAASCQSGVVFRVLVCMLHQVARLW